ncbi:hypothetical protein BaRGS_00007595 [Batillaria attramentaria]|uniref:Uncharacterized protein n=1 Tax=Batillaria attramentaria TaxID=370345 RepID=A0ABD0LNJ1_9CAEN
MGLGLPTPLWQRNHFSCSPCLPNRHDTTLPNCPDYACCDVTIVYSSSNVFTHCGKALVRQGQVPDKWRLQFCDFGGPQFCDFLQFGEFGGPQICDFVQSCDLEGPHFGDFLQFGDFGGPQFGDFLQFGGFEGLQFCDFGGP